MKVWIRSTHDYGLNCEFASVDGEIKSQIIQKCSSSRLRRRALRSPELSLKDLLNLGRFMEIAEQQAKEIEKTTEPVEWADQSIVWQFVNTKKWPKHGKKTQNFTSKDKHSKSEKPSNICRNCGGHFPPDKGRTSCPAYGQRCGNCSRMHHYSRCCLSSSSDDDYVYSVISPNSKHPRVQLMVHQTPVTFLIDRGASVNLTDETDFDKIKRKVTLKPCAWNVYLHGSTKPLKIKGEYCSAVIRHKSYQCNIHSRTRFKWIIA